MADIKFACPYCEQHIQAEPGYAGYQINCPACQGSLVVPGTAVSRPPPPTPVPAPPPAPAATAGCPSCGTPLPRGAVLCTNCGYNLATRQRTVAGRPAGLGKPKAPEYESPWYKTAYPYLAVVLLVLGVLYYLGRDNPKMMLAFVGTAALYSVTAHIIVVVAAFKESIGTGFLTLCVPFYGLYFVLKVSESDTLKVLYASAVIINFSLRFLVR